MAPERWNPLQELAQARATIDRMIDAVSRSPVTTAAGDQYQFVAGQPMFPIDVAESSDGYHVLASLPGVDAEHLRIQIAGATVMIQGERDQQRIAQSTTEHWILREHHMDALFRTFTLPMPVDADQAIAQLEHGVLTLSLPFAEPAAAPRYIPITTGSTSASLRSNDHAEDTGSAAPESASIALETDFAPVESDEQELPIMQVEDDLPGAIAIDADAGDPTTGTASDAELVSLTHDVALLIEDTVMESPITATEAVPGALADVALTAVSAADSPQPADDSLATATLDVMESPANTLALEADLVAHQPDVIEMTTLLTAEPEAGSQLDVCQSEDNPETVEDPRTSETPLDSDAILVEAETILAQAEARVIPLEDPESTELSSMMVADASALSFEESLALPQDADQHLVAASVEFLAAEPVIATGLADEVSMIVDAPPPTEDPQAIETPATDATTFMAEDTTEPSDNTQPADGLDGIASPQSSADLEEATPLAPVISAEYADLDVLGEAVVDISGNSAEEMAEESIETSETSAIDGSTIVANAAEE